MVVHYPRTVWKDSYAEHEVTGKHTIKKGERKKNSPIKIPKKFEKQDQVLRGLQSCGMTRIESTITC